MALYSIDIHPIQGNTFILIMSAVISTIIPADKGRAKGCLHVPLLRPNHPHTYREGKAFSVEVSITYQSSL